MIVELIEYRGLILAVNSVGQLIVWDIGSTKNSNEIVQFENNVSLVTAMGMYRVSQRQLLGILNISNSIVVYNRHAIFLFDFSKIRQVLDGSKESLIKIELRQHLQQNQKITCISVVNASTLLIGTCKSNLCLYSLQDKTILLKREVWNQLKHEKDNQLSFSYHFSKIPEITSISFFSNSDLVLVSFDNKIVAVKTNDLSVQNQVTQNIKYPLQKITKLYLKENEDKVYSIHQTYIVEWNYKLNSCIEYIQYNNPTGIIRQNNIFYIIGNCFNLTRIDKVPTECQLTMRSANVIKQIGRQTFAIGGSDNIVDIFIDNIRLMTLIPK